MTVKYGKIYVKDKLGNISEFLPQAQTVPNYTGATTTAAGIPGLVPGALSSERNNFLKADGTWAEVDLSSIISDLNAEISARETAISTLTDRVDDIEELAGAAYHFKGTVTDVNALPVSGNEVGDVWNIGSSLDGDNYAWTGTNWDKLGGTVDLSAYALDADVVHKAGAETITGVKTFNKNWFENVSALTGNQVDVSEASFFTKTITADTTLSFTGVPTGKAAVFTLMLTNGGAYDVTFPNNVVWYSGEQPELQETGTDSLTFFTPDGGTTWYNTDVVVPEIPEVSYSMTNGTEQINVPTPSNQFDGGIEPIIIELE